MIEGNEIRNFTLGCSGVFWIKYQLDDGRINSFTISLNPIELALLFELEGLDMKTPSRYDIFDDPEYDFIKVTLIPKYYRLPLFDECHKNISPLICEMKIQD